MIWVFNRVEYLVAYDLDRLNKVCEELSKAGIEYTYRTKDLTSPTVFHPGSRAHTGSFGINHDARIEYKLYIKKTDICRAKALL